MNSNHGLWAEALPAHSLPLQPPLPEKQFMSVGGHKTTRRARTLVGWGWGLMTKIDKNSYTLCERKVLKIPFKANKPPTPQNHLTVPHINKIFLLMLAKLEEIDNDSRN